MVNGRIGASSNNCKIDSRKRGMVCTMHRARTRSKAGSMEDDVNDCDCIWIWLCFLSSLAVKTPISNGVLVVLVVVVVDAIAVVVNVVVAS